MGTGMEEIKKELSEFQSFSMYPSRKNIIFML